MYRGQDTKCHRLLQADQKHWTQDALSKDTHVLGVPNHRVFNSAHAFAANKIPQQTRKQHTSVDEKRSQHTQLYVQSEQASVAVLKQDISGLGITTSATPVKPKSHNANNAAVCIYEYTCIHQANLNLSLLCNLLRHTSSAGCHSCQMCRISIW